MKSIRYISGLLLCFYSSISSAQWTQEANYPGGVTNAAVAFAIGDTIYVGGGSTGSTLFYKFDPATGKWTKKASTPPRALAACFSIGSKGYIALGESNPAETTANPQTSVTTELWQYDPTMDRWTEKSNFPGKPRDAAFAFVIGNKAYIGGGIDTGGFVLNDFYSYDPATDTWDSLQVLPEYLCFCATFSIGNYGYLATGSEGSAEFSLAWRYDPSIDSWTPIADFPGAVRESAVGFALNGKGYVGLGQSAWTTVFKDFYSYDPALDKWNLATTFPATYGRGWANGVVTSSAAFVGLGAYIFGPNLYGTNDLWTFRPSDEVRIDPAGSDLNVYPNPASDFVNLSLPQNVKSAHIIGENSIGVTCLNTQIHYGGHLDLSSLAPGIYNLEIISGTYHSIERVIKR